MRRMAEEEHARVTNPVATTNAIIPPTIEDPPGCEATQSRPRTNRESIEDLVKHVVDPPFGPNTIERPALDARRQSNPCIQSTFSRTVEKFGILNSVTLGAAIQAGSDVTGCLFGVGVPLVP